MPGWDEGLSQRDCLVGCDTHIKYGGDGYQLPYGPPYGAWTRYEVGVQVPGLRRPRVRTRSE